MSGYGTSEFDSAPARISSHLLALIGERFAMSASAAQARLGSGEPTDRIEASRELDDSERFGLQLQQLARMIGHADEAPRETVDMAAACRQIASEWKTRCAAAGVEVQIRGEAPKVQLNAAAFELIVDLLMEYGVVVGSRISVSIAPDLPHRGSVRVEITRRPLFEFDSTSKPADIDEVFPMLAMLLARGTGLQMRRSDIGSTIVLVVSVSAVPEEPADEGDGELPHTPIARGLRILIVDPRASSRLRCHQLLAAAGILVDAVETPAQAHQAWRDHDPDLLIIGVSSHEHDIVELLDEIRASLPGLRVIELVDEENAFAFAMPGFDAVGKLSRSEIETHLVAAVSQELYASRGD